MAVLRIRKLGDPVLREKARPVERFDGAFRRLVDDMFETMYAAPGVGLAAPQVGVSLRLFVYDDGEGNTGVVANPELSDLEDEESRDEGCLSIPGPFFPSVRSLRATVRGLDVEGRPLELSGDGLMARIFQHETDHTDGVLYIDRLPPEGRREVMRMLREHEVRQQQERSPTP
jgi:peptide deformylase